MSERRGALSPVCTENLIRICSAPQALRHSLSRGEDQKMECLLLALSGYAGWPTEGAAASHHNLRVVLGSKGMRNYGEQTYDDRQPI